MECGFGHPESEYEVTTSSSCGLAPRNAELSPFDPRIPEHLSSPIRRTFEFSVPRPESGTELRFELPTKFGICRSKHGVLGRTYQEITGRWLKDLFLDFQGGEINFFTNKAKLVCFSRNVCEMVPKGAFFFVPYSDGCMRPAA